MGCESKKVVRASAGMFTSPTPATFFHRVFADNGINTFTADSYFDPSLLTIAGGGLRHRTHCRLRRPA